MIAALQVPVDLLRHGNGAGRKRMSLSEYRFLSLLRRQKLVREGNSLLLGQVYLTKSKSEFVDARSKAYGNVPETE